jgi:hypothetical protein
MTLRASDLIGQRLQRVTVAWHEYKGDRSAHPVHVWLDLDSLGSVRAHTAGDGTLELSEDAPYQSHEMDIHGRIVVEIAGEELPLAPIVGHTLVNVRILHECDIDFDVGVVLEFDNGSVGIANHADDLVVLSWPSAHWADLTIEVAKM